MQFGNFCSRKLSYPRAALISNPKEREEEAPLALALASLAPLDQSIDRRPYRTRKWAESNKNLWKSARDGRGPSGGRGRAGIGPCQVGGPNFRRGKNRVPGPPPRAAQPTVQSGSERCYSTPCETRTSAEFSAAAAAAATPLSATLLSISRPKREN